MKQAKEEAQDEIEKYRMERERLFKEFEAKVKAIVVFVVIFFCYKKTNLIAYKHSD